MVMVGSTASTVEWKPGEKLKVTATCPLRMMTSTWINGGSGDGLKRIEPRFVLEVNFKGLGKGFAYKS